MPHNLQEYRVIEPIYRQPGARQNHNRPRRLIFFLAVFLPLLLAAQIYVFSQPAVYRSEASLLTTAATDVDQASAEADLQHVSIQKELLLGQSILEKTAELIQKNGDNVPPAAKLRSLFSAMPVTDTNLLKLAAEGSDPHFLQHALNAWIEAYRQARTDYVADISDKVGNSLKDELARLEQQIDGKRQEIDRFRLQHDIQSTESTDNQAHARLQGLNESLNLAMDDEVNAKAKMDAIHDAVARGKTVVPDTDSLALSVLVEQAGKLREKLEGLRGQYTDEYIRFNPALRKIPEELAKLDEKIDEKIKSGRDIAVQEADNNYAAAHQAVLTIQRQLAEHKKIAADYTSQFARHQALQQELADMERLQQDAKQRLIDIQVKQRQKYPQIEVIDAASLPGKPVRPDYWQESVLGFAISIATGLLAVWIGEYLRREETPTAPEAVSAGFAIHERRVSLGEFGVAQPIRHDPVKALAGNAAPRELSHEETTALFSHADQQTRVILALLLNGLSVGEILSLRDDCLDTERHSIFIPQSGRRVGMTRCSAALLAASPWQPLHLAAEELDALLSCAAIDGGLFAPEEIGAETISFTYTLFLIRQGLKLSELSKIIGPISPGRLLMLGKFSPDSPGLPLDKIDLEYLQNAG